ncbi:hypothetical protein ACO1O0_003976 [Amphichorda felina]
MRSVDQPPTNTQSNSLPKSILPITASSSFPPTSSHPKAPTLFTPKTPRPVPSRTRPPLRVRDNNQNAPSLSPKPTIITTASASTTRSTIVTASTRTMPVGGGDNNRPRQPQLSAAAARACNRPPLTPKVATTKQQPAVSPLTGRRPHTGKDDTSSAASAPFLAANVTGRSGSRQTRGESANSTPSGTPNPDKKYDGWDANKTGFGVSGPAFDGGKSGSQVGHQHDAPESKFFYASDARPTSQGSMPRPATLLQKPATFLYANGVSAEGKRNTTPPSIAHFAPTLSTTPEPNLTKFFYANGAPDYHSRPGLMTTGSGSTVSTSSRMTNSRPGTGNSAPTPAPSVTSRPISPIKAASTPSATPTLQGSAMPPGPVRSPSVISAPTLAPAPIINGKRRVSIEVPARETPPPAHRGHSRAGSVPGLDQLVVPKYARSPQTPDTTSAPLSPGHSRPAMTMASILQVADDLREDEDSKDDDSQPEVQSPTKSSHSNEPVNELVANARRERKVQDLEITNASLEAINRTLERQLRKQTAELRRYRRLSRAGRLSTVSGASSRVASAALTDPPVDLSDLSEEDQNGMDDQDSFHESDFSSDETGSADEPTSPNAKMAARRKRDEIRLQLDLTKHQELLIDSQKINQSIKRCLDWTEVLIKEGQKALEYSVKVSDVELGGHVLAPPDEDEDETASYQGDDQSAKAPSPTLEPLPIKTGQDRDSGIELPVDGG